MQNTALTSVNPSQPLPDAVAGDDGERTLAMFRQARQQFGMDRIQLGALLVVIRQNSLWKGRATSWNEFLAAEHINPNAARQYMNVASRLVFDMNLDEVTMAKLASVGLTALDKAMRVITPENRDQVLTLLTSLGEKDAIQAIIDMGDAGKGQDAQKINLRVIRLLRDFHDLPPDLQQEFRSTIIREKPASGGAISSNQGGNHGVAQG